MEVEEGSLEPVKDGAVGEGEEHLPGRLPFLRAGGRREIVVAVVIAVEEGAGVGVAGPREGEQLRQLG